MNKKQAFLAVLLLVSGGLYHAQAGDAEALHSYCLFHNAGDHFVGSCGTLFDQTPVMTLRHAAAPASGIWREDIHPTSIWTGDMTDRGYPNAPLELEIYGTSWGVLRTEYGWFAVTQFRLSSTLSFDLDATHEVSPNALDEKIVREAAVILSTDGAWNRADNRKCPESATTWSIYCAMEKATIDVTGGFHHRRPALEIVREIVDERTTRRNYHHRLMDYNNDPTTHLGDVRSLFSEALMRMKRS